MERPPLIQHYIKRLNGTIVIVGGNHDTRKCCAEFQRLGITVMGALEYKGYIVTHIPLAKEQAKEYRGNIHGHIHSFEIPSSRYISIVADLNSYTPLTLEEIITTILKAKQNVPNAHFFNFKQFMIKNILYRYFFVPLIRTIYSIRERISSINPKTRHVF